MCHIPGRDQRMCHIPGRDQHMCHIPGRDGGLSFANANSSIGLCMWAVSVPGTQLQLCTARSQRSSVLGSVDKLTARTHLLLARLGLVALYRPSGSPEWSFFFCFMGLELLSLSFVERRMPVQILNHFQVDPGLVTITKQYTTR